MKKVIKKNYKWVFIFVLITGILLLYGCIKSSGDTKQQPQSGRKTRQEVKSTEQDTTIGTLKAGKPEKNKSTAGRNVQKQELTTIDAETAFKLIKSNKNNSNFIILDVRTPDEYAEGHIENSRLIDFYSRDFKNRLGKLDKNKEYFIYCRSGSRSGRTLQIMKKLKFKRVYNLGGGIISWQSARLPLVK
ncbi:MAG: rhodanese-like domain-containing protein [Spirochaetes bacterium]|nr:rhodanese-like domain-containing protein [Spirochaetota bacterium]